MSEEEKPKEKPKEPVPKDVQEPKPDDLIAKANEAAERLEKANKALEENLKKQEALQVKTLLGGKSEAGIPEMKETPEDYAKRVMRGDL